MPFSFPSSNASVFMGARLIAAGNQTIPITALTQVTNFQPLYSEGGNFYEPGFSGLIVPVTASLVSVFGYVSFAGSISGNRVIQIKIGGVDTPAKFSMRSTATVVVCDMNVSWSAVIPANPGNDVITLHVSQTSTGVLDIVDFSLSAEFR